MIGRHANRGALRFRRLASAAPPEPARQLSPAMLAAVVIHAALIAGLAAWKAPVLVGAARSEFVSATITFAGLREPSEIGGGGGGGGNPNAGGRGSLRSRPPRMRVPTTPAVKPDLAPPPLPRPRLPAVIAVETASPVPYSGFVPSAPSPSVFAENQFGMEGAAGQGAGWGNGTGTGIGNRSEDGIAGGGTGSGGGLGNGVGDGIGDGIGFGGANYLRSPQPQYPAIARQQGWEGTVVLRVQIQADGKIGAIQILQSTGHKVLDDAAIEAVRAAQFQPARHNGVPITSWVEVPVTFRLNRG